MTLIVGLTGSIGTGKSTVSRYIKSLNIPVIDADIIARDVVKPGRIAHQKIKEEFGNEVFFEDNTLNRKALGAIIFADQTKRKRLNEIIHPEIRKEMLTQKERYIRNKEKCVVMDIPLLFESGLTDYVEKIIVVATDEITQLNRLMQRDGMTNDEATARIDSQISIRTKEKRADVVIDNNHSKEATYQQVKEVFKKWNVLS